MWKNFEFEFLSFFNFWLDVNMYVAGVQLSAWFMRLKSYFTPVLSRSEQSSTFHCQAKNCAIGQLRASFWLVLSGFERFCHNLRNIWKIEIVPHISKLAKVKPFGADFDLTMKSGHTDFMSIWMTKR
jgi:hypothetical protein